MKVRQLAVAAVIAVTAPAFVQCSSEGTSSAGESGVVHYGSIAPSSMDPRQSGPLSAVFLTNIYDSLIDRTPAGEIGPGLATEWRFSADAKTFDLTLREDVTFQDGEIFDAAAVEANLNALKASSSAWAADLEAIQRVEVVDAQHVRLHLSRPASQLVGALAGEAGMMISPKALDDPDLATKPVGAGPYKLTKYSQGELVYTAWDGYWNKDAVKNKLVVFSLNADSNTQFRAVKSGQLNLFGASGSLVDAAEDAGFEITGGKTSTVWQLVLNTTNAKLAKPAVRKAISLALDRDGISKAFAAGRCAPTVQPFVEGVVGHVEELEGATAQDLGKAKQLMDEAGFKDGFEIELLLSTSDLQKTQATVIQSDLKKIGITIKLAVVDQPQSNARQRKGQFDMVVSISAAGRPDPSSYVSTFYAKGGSVNPGFVDEGVEAKLLEAQATDVVEDRQQILGEIVTSVYEAGSPTIPICNNPLNFVHPDNVTGFEVPVLNDYDFASVTVK